MPPRRRHPTPSNNRRRPGCALCTPILRIDISAACPVPPFDVTTTPQPRRLRACILHAIVAAQIAAQRWRIFVGRWRRKGFGHCDKVSTFCRYDMQTANSPICVIFLQPHHIISTPLALCETPRTAAAFIATQGDGARRLSSRGSTNDRDASQLRRCVERGMEP